MFVIQQEQLLRLSDAGLRELAARLCQAELSRRGAPVNAVRWGGSHLPYSKHVAEIDGSRFGTLNHDARGFNFQWGAHCI